MLRDGIHTPNLTAQQDAPIWQHENTCHAAHSASWIWAVRTLCALHQTPCDEAMLAQQFPPPHDHAAMVRACTALGFTVQWRALAVARLATMPLPALLALKPQHIVPKQSAAEQNSTPADQSHFGILISTNDTQALWLPPNSSAPQTLPIDELAKQLTGQTLLIKRADAALQDPDSIAAQSQAFGFRWFIPELAKHRSVWRDVLLASLVLQLLALTLPLFTQAIIDKVVVNRSESTLVALGIGMGVFMAFTAILTWVRQYAILHTGNRVDAALGSAVFTHLFKLPPQYFQNRPTGIIAARLHGVETIREFIASAAVSLVLDIPFLLVCVVVMFYYSVTLTCIVLGILSIIAILSFMVAPIFHSRLNEQFLLGARNQAFVTEYVGGLETVKSLQLEPQLQNRYDSYLASYLQSGFQTKQIGNTYNVIANTLEQAMTLLVLLVGAWLVMHPEGATAGNVASVFTIGMLVAFQMFASKLSQPVLRMVGLWQQFQQASLAVSRLGDLMNSPIEPYSAVPTRKAVGAGHIEIHNLGFRYSAELPLLYSGASLVVQPGHTVAIMGPSGTGKSTLTKLLQGFYRASEGQIKIDGIDILNLSANELRSYFGVVPQETVLFSGTVFDNLAMANPLASFEDVVHACQMAEVHSTIEQLPKGYQTEIGERGAGLSGGQKQRIAIARALLKKPKILIFDEATSALDAQTANAFAATINALRGKVSMLFVTHALPKALQVDDIFLIGDGRIQRAAPKQPPASQTTQSHTP